MNNESLRDVYVGGVGMIKFGRYPEENVATLGAQAVQLALADGGMQLNDIEMMAAGCLYQTNMIGQKILKEIGMTGIPVYNVANACATGSTAFREAYFAVGSGAYDIALAVGVEQMGKRGLLGGITGDPAYSPEGVMGTGTMPGVFGMAGLEHSRQYGTTIEQFAQVSVKNHEHAMANPLSQYQVRVSLEDVLNARMVAYPNTLYMCCPTGDGAAAAVVMSKEKAKQFSSELNQGRCVGVDHGSVHGPRTDVPGRQHDDRECGREKRTSRPASRRWISTAWSCTTVSRRPKCCTTRICSWRPRAKPDAGWTRS